MKIFLVIFAIAAILVFGVKTTSTNEVVAAEVMPPLEIIDIPKESGWRLPIHEETILSSDSKDHATRSPYIIKYAWDFYATRGTLVYPSEAGTVIVASYGNEGCYGHWVQIDHGNSISSLYGHLGTLRVTVGQYVTSETALGEIANTGCTDWPHVHFEVRRDSLRFEPAEVFGQPSAIGLRYQHFTKIGDYW